MSTIEWPYCDLTINESEIRILLPPCPRLIILYELFNRYIAVSKSAEIISSVTSLPVNESIQSNRVPIKWLSLKKLPLHELVLRLNRPIALTRIEL
jgi:hypothetical protein